MNNNKYRFEEIICEIKELLEEAINLVPDHARSRANAYWYAHISTSLDNDHDYMGGSMCSMQDTSEQFYEEEEDEEEDQDLDTGVSSTSYPSLNIWRR
jgi:hypothetical protein